MDLGAYAQIDNLGQIMKDNGIDIPRLRGLRLMKDKEPGCQKFRDELDGNGFCPYGKEFKDESFE